MKEIDIAALLCSRLCHDLISPVSGVSNGMEILDDETDPHMRDQVFDLIRKSSQQSSDMVQFYRVAFGAGGGMDGQVEVAKTLSVIEGFLTSKKITLNSNFEADFLPKNINKLLLNIILIAAECLVRGGEMDVTLGGGSNLLISVKGTTLILYPPIREIISSNGEADEFEPRTVPLVLIYDILSSLKAKLSMNQNVEGRLSFEVNLPINI